LVQAFNLKTSAFAHRIRSAVTSCRA